MVHAFSHVCKLAGMCAVVCVVPCVCELYAVASNEDCKLVCVLNTETGANDDDDARTRTHKHMRVNFVLCNTRTATFAHIYVH